MIETEQLPPSSARTSFDTTFVRWTDGMTVPGWAVRQGVRGIEYLELAASRREPEMGANVFRRLPTQHDVARMFSQVRGSLIDAIRR